MEAHGSDLEAALAAVDSHAQAVLECWGNSAASSAEGMLQFQLMYESAVGAPREALNDIQRLQLVALTTKVLGLLASVQGELGHQLVTRAWTWVAEARTVLANPEKAASWDWVIGLRAVRDTARGVSSGAGEAGVAAVLAAGMVPQGDRAQLMLALLGAVRRISNELLPPRERRKPTDIVSNTDGSITTVGDSPDLPEALPRAEPPLGGSPWSRTARQQPQRAAAEGPYSRAKAGRPIADGVAAVVPGAAREAAGAIVCAPGVKLPTAAPTSSLGPAAAAHLLFDAPLLGFQDPREPSAASVPVVRSAAIPDLLSAPATATAPRDIIPSRRGHSPWSEEEELRLIEGYRRWGSSWERIRAAAGLGHRKGTQLREKWRNLVKAGAII